MAEPVDDLRAELDEAKKSLTQTAKRMQDFQRTLSAMLYGTEVHGPFTVILTPDGAIEDVRIDAAARVQLDGPTMLRELNGALLTAQMNLPATPPSPIAAEDDEDVLELAERTSRELDRRLAMSREELIAERTTTVTNDLQTLALRFEEGRVIEIICDPRWIASVSNDALTQEIVDLSRRGVAQIRATRRRS